MRLDVAVNMLSYQALENQSITVLGGEQIRPNIHIDDLANLYLFFVEAENNLNGIYNAGFENLKIIDIAEMIAAKTKSKIIIKESNDPRSYRLCSDKLLETGFRTKKTVMNAISEISDAWIAGLLKNKPEWHTMNWMKTHNLGPETNVPQIPISA